MAKQIATLTITVEYDDGKTDADTVADALDTLLATATSTEGVLDECGPIALGSFAVTIEKDA